MVVGILRGEVHLKKFKNSKLINLYKTFTLVKQHTQQKGLSIIIPPVMITTY